MRALLSVALAAMVCSVLAGNHGRIVNSAIPHGWKATARVDAQERVKITVAVKLRNLDILEQTLLEVSDPTHENWGHHLSWHETNVLTANKPAARAILAWLNALAGVDSDFAISSCSGFVSGHLPAHVIERTFDAHLFHFVHTSGATAINAHSFRIPAAVQHHVDFISVLNRLLPSTRPKLTARKVVKAADPPANSVSPQTLFTTYNIPSQAVANAGATSGLFESGQYFVPLDVQEFQANFSIQNDPVANIVGNNDPSQCSNINNCAEAELDIQYLLAMAQGSQLTFWSINPQSQTPFLDWIQMVSAMTNPPSVHSISYGEVESQGDPNVMKRFNAEVMKLGAQGVSVMVASGDDGVANFPARQDPSQCGFQPSYPANDPYVTSVGATQGPESGSAEIACTSDQGGGITTGGGFSINFPAPDWQSAAVQQYLKTAPNLPPLTDFNSHGRGYPDVALLGHAYNIIVGSQMYQVDGTSASSPVFAGVIAQINGARLAAGKKTLGMLNQAIYQLAATTPAAFNDITSGTNNCCAGLPGQQTCCALGFTAAAGWDPLTGWGSINYPAFSAALIALP